MNENERYQRVQHDIRSLMDQATNDSSEAGMLGFGATWLAAEMYRKNEQDHERFRGNTKRKPENT